MGGAKRFILFLWFYLGWFGCVYCERYHVSEVSLVFPAVSWLLWWIWDKPTWNRIQGLLIIAGIGMVFDALALNRGWILLNNSDFILLPLWLIALWLLYVSVLPLSYSILKQRLVWGALLGGIFGPLSYYSGEALGVLRFNGNYAILIYGLFWVLFFPFSLFLQRKFQ